MGSALDTLKGWFNKAAESSDTLGDPVAAKQEAELKRMISAEFMGDTPSPEVLSRWSQLSAHSRQGVTIWINRQCSMNGASVLYRAELLSAP